MGHCKEFCSDKGLMLKTSALKLFVIDKTKLLCYTLPLTQHHSFFGHLPPLIPNQPYYQIYNLSDLHTD